jgi:hypothetical protein
VRVDAVHAAQSASRFASHCSSVLHEALLMRAYFAIAPTAKTGAGA